MLANAWCPIDRGWWEIHWLPHNSGPFLVRQHIQCVCLAVADPNQSKEKWDWNSMLNALRTVSWLFSMLLLHLIRLHIVRTLLLVCVFRCVRVTRANHWLRDCMVSLIECPCTFVPKCCHKELFFCTNFEFQHRSVFLFFFSSFSVLINLLNQDDVLYQFSP